MKPVLQLLIFLFLKLHLFHRTPEIRYRSKTSKIIPNLNSTSTHLARDFYLLTGNMNPSSSSVERTHKYADQVCILVCCFWGCDPDSSEITQSRFAASVSEYISQMFGNEIEPSNVLKYYSQTTPQAMKDAGLPYTWDGNTLAISIAHMTQDSQEYDKLTNLSLVSRNILS